MIETSSEGPSKLGQLLRMRINHPKLHDRLFVLPKDMPFALVLKELKRDSLLSLFQNYHFQID